MEYCTLYTYQHPAVLDQLKYRNYISGDSKYAWNNGWESFERPYKWMMNQMSQRLQNFSGDLPIWAYNRHRGKQTTTDDHGTKRDLLMLRVRVPKERVLYSDLDMWHMVLNDGPIYDNEYDFDHKHFTEEQKTESWNKIFDIKHKRTIEEQQWFGKTRSLQVCIDRVYRDEFIR